MPVRVCGPRSKAPKNAQYINTTSRDTGFAKGLSPFFLGPVKMYWNVTAKNVENAWQFSKVYEHHVSKTGVPTDDWAKWAIKGFNDSYAHRYPAGKGKKPAFSYWDGKLLGYIDARKQIYCPLYTQAVLVSPAYKQLVETFELAEQEGDDLWLWDFDGYDHVKRGMSLEEVLNEPKYKMGHAFVLAMLLEDNLYWKEQ